MKKTIEFFAAALLVVLPMACNRTTPEQMAANASKITVTVVPEVLTEIDGKVDAKLEVTFPKGYFHKDALLTVTPVLVYKDGETPSKAFEYQGENVKDNYKTVSFKGSTHKESVSFQFTEAMRASRLELRPVILYAGRVIGVPYVTVAEGVCATARLADLDGRCDLKADGYEAILHKTAEAQILYDVNSSTVKKSQLSSYSVANYHDALDRYKENDRYTVKGTSIVSYASPEGGKDYNEKLSDKRSGSAQKAWDVIGRGMKADDLDVQSIGQDWEGFKEAVAKSNIRDKDLILRVLSMYNDPAVRESEIRNLSQIYTELKSDVFPELRRSRFVTDLEFRNYSDEDLEILAQQKLYMLDETGLLHLAGVTDSPARKEFIYNFAYEKFGSKTALFNMAAQAISDGETTKAGIYLDKLADEEDPEVINARGLLELAARNWYKSEDLFEKAATDQSKENLATLYLLQGNYEKSASFYPEGHPDRPVALILAGKPDEALKALKGDDARSNYLRAIASARKGDTDGVKKYLEASSSDPYFAELAKKDVEFVKFR